MMKGILRLFVLSWILGGCARVLEDSQALKDLSPLTPVQSTGSGQETPPFQGLEALPALKNIQDETTIQEPLTEGIVFGKTDFQGVLQTSYVVLAVNDLKNEEKNYQIIIGEKGNPSLFSSKMPIVQPGYFFIQLPAGKYQFPSISIPVGTTMAMEAMDVRFEVKSGKVIYLGTLKVVGTKERIKLGGVPVFQPGFEYAAQVLDETREAERIFQKRYPNIRMDIDVELMKVNTLVNEGEKEGPKS